VEEFAKLIEEIWSDEQGIFHCGRVQMMLRDDEIVPSPVGYSS